MSRKQRVAIVAGAYPVLFFLVAGQTITPFMRYSLPLVPALAITAGALCADLMAHPRWRRAGAW